MRVHRFVFYQNISMRIFHWIATSLCAMSSAHVQTQTHPASPGHRVLGAVWLGPTCAGAQREGDACHSPLAGVEVRLSNDAGLVVAWATTAPAGAFDMHAPAGHYRLRVSGVVKPMRCPVLDVMLPRPKPTPLELECDSGMR